MTATDRSTTVDVSIHPAQETGVALVIVLWMLVLLSAIATNITFSVRTEITVAANLVASAEAEAAADAGLHKAIYELLQPETDFQRWRGDGLEHIWQFGEARMRVTIRDESGKIDLNGAPATLFAGLFTSLGVPENDAVSLADAIVDWRDPDSLRSLHGAEKDDYTDAGKSYGPANTPFETIDELRLVLGMNERLFRELETLVTVYTHRNSVNAAVAPRAVLLAIPGATQGMVDSYIEQRNTVIGRGLPPPPFPLAAGQSGSISFFAIEVDVDLRENTRFVREAVVRMVRTPTDPFVILAWRAPRPSYRLLPDPGSVVPNG